MAKESLCTILHSYIVYCFCNNSIHTGQAVHHHSFMTVFAISTCLHEVCNNSFSTQMGHVGPNAGWHEEFLVFCYPVGQSSDCFGGLSPSSAHDLCNISGSNSRTIYHVYKIPLCQPSYIIIQSGKNIWRNGT